MAELSIVIVNWNSKDYVRECVASILPGILRLDYEIIVVDSGSFDGCGEMLRCAYPQVRFVQSEHNLGFGRANNLGVRHSSGRVLLLLNPDTEVRGDAIEKLHAYLGNLPRTGVVGCRLLNSDGSLQTSCVQPMPTILNQLLNAAALQRWFPKVSLWTTAATYEAATAPVPVEVISGACMMIKREVFEQVGGFSPDYFMYAEDLDLCYKTRAKGLLNYYVREVEIVHHGGGSTRRKFSRFGDVLMRESVWRLIRKVHGEAYGSAHKVVLTGGAIARLALLAFAAPVAIARRRGLEWRNTAHKWLAILRWGLGTETWVRNYDRLEELSPNAGENSKCVESAAS